MKGRDAEDSDDFGFGEASRYAAHLDRGWALLDRGDHAAARTSAEHAAEARPDDPDAAVLLGAVSLAEGNADDGLRWYERAIELDPEYLEPYTAAAQVCLYDLDDPARGLRYCSDALELEVLSPFDRLDLHLVAAECELSLGLLVEPRRRLATLDEEAVLMSTLRLAAQPELLDEFDDQDPDDDKAVAVLYLRRDGDEELDEEERVERIGRALQLAFRLARMRLDLGDAETPTGSLTEILRWYPGEPDAWGLVSEAHFRASRLPEASVAALKTLELDHELPVPDWVPSFALVHRRVVQVVKECPEPIIGALVDIPLTVMVRDAPAPELVMEGVDPRVAVLALAGRPGMLLDGAEETEPPPPQLTGLAVYRRNLARFARDPEQFDQQLRFSVLDELATFVGLPDDARGRLGLPPLGPDPSASLTSAGVVPPSTDEAEGEETGKSKRKRGRRRRSRAPN
ncbi:tetratricopeptide repeat protein [Paraliomyxa miuraensis]|uniref:tetratricopeptide repeat protein n=1 Tax=Paraliomyxa miuraensis TaxID=376150 RepID=UPI00224D0ABA|nr:tetratricopeptide repeat protein [Paraliomyxa miuraensis]MCX4245711.1 tetratricopeptide repeat protein [Paraliomyxa miuraensis]